MENSENLLHSITRRTRVSIQLIIACSCLLLPFLIRVEIAISKISHHVGNKSHHEMLDEKVDKLSLDVAELKTIINLKLSKKEQ